MRFVIFALLASLAGTLRAECDCTIYPFEPNPPCHNQCRERIASDPAISLSSIKNLPQQVFDDLEALRQQHIQMDGPGDSVLAKDPEFPE